MATIDVAAIKAAHPIESVIERMTGQRIERNKICCPFHDDGSPSLHVYDDGGWKCFGCGLGGDVFSFIGYLSPQPTV
jgi:DNA primase